MSASRGESQAHMLTVIKRSDLVSCVAVYKAVFTRVNVTADNTAFTCVSKTDFIVVSVRKKRLQICPK